MIIKVTEPVLISDSGAASRAEACQNFNDFDLLYIKYSLGFHVTTGKVSSMDDQGNFFSLINHNLYLSFVDWTITHYFL